MTAPSTPEESGAYRRHPDTFSGVDTRANRKAETPLDLFDFLMDTYGDPTRERLLELMADHPDFEKLQHLSKQEVTEIYAERCTYSMMEHSREG